MSPIHLSQAIGVSSKNWQRSTATLMSLLANHMKTYSKTLKGENTSRLSKKQILLILVLGSRWSSNYPINWRLIRSYPDQEIKFAMVNSDLRDGLPLILDTHGTYLVKLQLGTHFEWSRLAELVNKTANVIQLQIEINGHRKSFKLHFDPGCDRKHSFCSKLPSYMVVNRKGHKVSGL